MAQIPGKWDTLIPRKTPAQPALPRMARNHASHARRHDQTLQRNSPSFGREGLEKESQDRNASDITEEAGEILHAEEHGDGVEPGSDKADRDGTHNGNGNHLLRAMDLFGEMGGAVEAGKCPVGVDQAHDEGWVLSIICTAAQGDWSHRCHSGSTPFG